MVRKFVLVHRIVGMVEMRDLEYHTVVKVEMRIHLMSCFGMGLRIVVVVVVVILNMELSVIINEGT